MRIRAFSVVEILVVVGIIGVLTAISLPVWSGVRKSAQERGTENSLRQTWLALELYRADQTGSAETGTSSQMGLPNIDGFYALVSKKKIPFWRQEGKKGYGPVYYPYDPSDFIPGSEVFNRKSLDTWLNCVERDRSATVVVADFNHTTGCSELPSFDCFFNAVGVDLTGSLRRQKGPGNYSTASWWNSNTHEN